MARGLPPAPRWAWIVMALGVVSIVVLTYLTLNRPPPPRFSGPSAAGAVDTRATGTPTAPSATSPGEQGASPAPLRMLVVGDGLTTVDAAGGGAAWPELLRADLAAAGQPVDLVVATADLAGYAEPDPGGATFAGLARNAGSGFDLVVFFGSRHDIAAAADVRAAAQAAFTLAREASPDARLVVIGPAWAGTPPGYIVTNRDALAAAADPADVVFVDPLAAGWFTGPAAEFIAPGGVRATPDGHRYLADLVRPVVGSVLG